MVSLSNHPSEPARCRTGPESKGVDAKGQRRPPSISWKRWSCCSRDSNMQLEQ